MSLWTPLAAQPLVLLPLLLLLLDPAAAQQSPQAAAAASSLPSPTIAGQETEPYLVLECPSPPTFDALDTEAYMGMWHDVAETTRFRLENGLNGLVDVQAQNTLVQSGTPSEEIVGEANSGRRGDEVVRMHMVRSGRLIVSTPYMDNVASIRIASHGTCLSSFDITRSVSAAAPMGSPGGTATSEGYPCSGDGSMRAIAQQARRVRALVSDLIRALVRLCYLNTAGSSFRTLASKITNRSHEISLAAEAILGIAANSSSCLSTASDIAAAANAILQAQARIRALAPLFPGLASGNPPPDRIRRMTFTEDAIQDPDAKGKFFFGGTDRGGRLTYYSRRRPNYWILDAVRGDAAGNDSVRDGRTTYAAALVWSCETEVEGYPPRVSAWYLSRTKTLSRAIRSRFARILARSGLGVGLGCDNIFIETPQAQI